jgi:hypothetical protein
MPNFTVHALLEISLIEVRGVLCPPDPGLERSTNMSQKTCAAAADAQAG